MIAYRFGSKFYEVDKSGKNPRLVEVSPEDIKNRQNGRFVPSDFPFIDPSDIYTTKRGDTAIRQLGETGDILLPKGMTAENFGAGIPQSTTFSDYLRATGQTRALEQGASGAPVSASVRTLTNLTPARSAQDIISEALGPKSYDQISPEAQSYRRTGQLGTSVASSQPGAISGQPGASAGTEGGISSAAGAVLEGMKARGLTINPSVPITPQAAAEFMAFASQNANAFLPYAQKEIAPYYQTQLKLASDTLAKSLGYSEQQILQNEQEVQRKYAENLKQIGVSAAEHGFAQSGIRQLNEQNLAANTQNDINQKRRELAFNEGNKVAEFAQRYGSSNLPSVASAPAPRVLPGQSHFDLSGPASPFYTLSPEVYNGLTGSEQFAEKSAEAQRASQLEGLYNQYNSLGRTLPT